MTSHIRYVHMKPIQAIKHLTSTNAQGTDLQHNRWQATDS